MCFQIIFSLIVQEQQRIQSLGPVFHKTLPKQQDWKQRQIILDLIVACPDLLRLLSLEDLRALQYVPLGRKTKSCRWD